MAGDDSLRKALKNDMWDELEESKDKPATAARMLEGAKNKPPQMQELILELIAEFFGLGSNREQAVERAPEPRSQGEHMSANDRIKNALADLLESAKDTSPEHQEKMAKYSAEIITALDGGKSAREKSIEPMAEERRAVAGTIPANSENTDPAKKSPELVNREPAKKFASEEAEKEALAYKMAEMILGKNGEKRDKTLSEIGFTGFMAEKLNITNIFASEIDVLHKRMYAEEGTREYDALQGEKYTLAEQLKEKFSVQELRERTSDKHAALAVAAAEGYGKAAGGSGGSKTGISFLVEPRLLQNSDSELRVMVDVADDINSSYIELSKRGDEYRKRVFEKLEVLEKSKKSNDNGKHVNNEDSAQLPSPQFKQPLAKGQDTGKTH